LLQGDTVYFHRLQLIVFFF